MFEPNLLRILKDDHREILQRTNELAEIHDPERLDAARRGLAVLWRVHCLLEEEFLYEALADRFEDPRGSLLLHRAREEHTFIDAVFDRLLAASPSSPRVPLEVDLLMGYVETHIADEERALYTRAKKLIGREWFDKAVRRLYGRRDEVEFQIEQEVYAQVH